jgi:hypothetical protein
LVVAVPRDVDDPLDLVAHAVKGWIIKALADPSRKFLTRELDVALAFADFRHRG